jgi:hypothetical protein
MNQLEDTLDIVYQYCDTCDYNLNDQHCNNNVCYIRDIVTGDSMKVDTAIFLECIECQRYNDNCLGDDCLLFEVKP